MLKQIICSVVLLSSLLASCKKEDFKRMDSSVEREEQVLKSLKFLPLEQQSTLRAMGDPDLNLVIVSIDWGRKKYDCKRGFGICGVQWFPGLKDLFTSTTIHNEASLSTYLRINPVTGEAYLELPLAEAPSTGFTEKDLELKVDKTLELVSSGDDTLGATLVIPPKHYGLDKTVGDHGGYKIALATP